MTQNNTNQQQGQNANQQNQQQQPKEAAKVETVSTRTFEQLIEATTKGKTLKDFSTVEQRVYLEGLMKGSNITLNNKGEISTPKLGQVGIKTTSAKGKEYEVKLYATENGQVHFQGAPGTSAKFGRSMSCQELEFYFTNLDTIVLWMDENKASLSRMESNGKIYLGGKEVVKQ